MSNIHLLTRSHSAIAVKRQAKREQIKEIVFDDDARREFLTGFHKRKLAKADAARKKAAERDKQQHKGALREQRRTLREKAIENAAQVEAAYGALAGDVDSGDDWTGISEKTTGKQKEEEYEDEEVLATVAVVEDFDPDTLIHGPIVKTVPQSAPVAPQTPKRAPVAKKPKPKKVKYQTKDARKAEKGRQRSRRTEKAELAGGKASRKKGPGKKKR